MSSWGGSATNQAKPKWLTTAGKNTLDNCYATELGWVYKHKDGSEEVLVAIANLATKLAGATISEVFFNGAAYSVGAGGTINVTVIFTEPVTVTGSPTLLINATGGAGPFTLTYSAGTGTDTLNFQSAAIGGLTNITGKTISIPAQTIAKNGGNIVGADDGATAVNLAFLTTVRVGAAHASATYADIAVTA